jgi:hypothetical protein
MPRALLSHQFHRRSACTMRKGTNEYGVWVCRAHCTRRHGMRGLRCAARSYAWGAAQAPGRCMATWSFHFTSSFSWDSCECRAAGPQRSRIERRCAYPPHYLSAGAGWAGRGSPLAMRAHGVLTRYSRGTLVCGGYPLTPIPLLVDRHALLLQEPPCECGTTSPVPRHGKP